MDDAAVHAPRPCRHESAGGDRRPGLALRAFPDLVLAAHRAAGRIGGGGPAAAGDGEGARTPGSPRRGRRRLVRGPSHRRRARGPPPPRRSQSPRNAGLRRRAVSALGPLMNAPANSTTESKSNPGDLLLVTG